MIFYQDNDFTLEYQEWDNIWFIHCLVSKWNLKSFKKGLSVFKEMHKQALEKKVKGLMTISPNPKFCQLLAGIFVGKVQKDGLEYEVYKWELIP